MISIEAVLVLHVEVISGGTFFWQNARDGFLGNCGCPDCRILHVTSPLRGNEGTRPPRGAARSPAGGQVASLSLHFRAPRPAGTTSATETSKAPPHTRTNTLQTACPHYAGDRLHTATALRACATLLPRFHSLPAGRPTSTFCPGLRPSTPPFTRMRQTRGFPGSGDCFRPNHLRGAAEGGALGKGESTDGGDGAAAAVPPRRTGPMWVMSWRSARAGGKARSRQAADGWGPEAGRPGSAPRPLLSPPAPFGGVGGRRWMRSALWRSRWCARAVLGEAAAWSDQAGVWARGDPPMVSQSPARLSSPRFSPSVSLVMCVPLAVLVCVPLRCHHRSVQSKTALWKRSL